MRKRQLSTIPLVAIIGSFLILGIISAFATTFEDVPESHWASKYIQCLANAGIIDGYGNGNYGPEDNVTYAQFMKLLVEAIAPESLAENTAKFKVGESLYVPCEDLDTNHWAYIYVATGIERGIISFDLEISFKNEIKFYPDSKISREQVAIWIANGLSLDLHAEKSYYFTDVPDVYESRRHINAVNNAGIMYGVREDYFGFKDLLTRAQACAIIYRVMDYIDAETEQENKRVKPKDFYEIPWEVDENQWFEYDASKAGFDPINE